MTIIVQKPDDILPETPGKTADFQKILDRLKITPGKKEEPVGK